MAESPDADLFLVREIRKGDQRAWKQLIDKYQGRLLAFARSRLRGPGEAEDALQETLMGFVTSLANYDESRSLETYLFAILRYKIGEVLTKKNRRREVATGFDIDDDAQRPIDPGVDETPSARAAQAEITRQQQDVLSAILRRLIDELRDRDKLDDLQVIELIFYVGLRNKEVADRLERDEKGVAGVKFRALAKLRDYIEDLDEAQRNLLGEGELSSETTVSRVWRQGRLSCLKRSTLGSYVLGVLDDPWDAYTRFHLDDVQCLMCRANLEDLSQESERVSEGDVSDRLFQSSVGFLSQRGGA